MSAALLKGRPVAKRMRAQIKTRAQALAERRGRPPVLAIAAIGGDPSAEMYRRKKKQACAEVGIECRVESVPVQAQEAEVRRLLSGLSEDPAVDAIMLDMPLPPHMDLVRLIDAISPDKDVEGVTTPNVGRIGSEKSFSTLVKERVLIPCTPNAIVHLLLETGIEPAGKHAVVVGRSNIVGKPTARLLAGLDATVTLCHAMTRDLGGHVSRAEILVSAIGKPGIIRGSWILPGAVVLDAGLNAEDGKILGDVEFGPAAERAAYITPVPGGIGPLTVTFLLHNILLAAENTTGGQILT